MHGKSSEKTEITFQTKRIALPIDITVVLELSPTLPQQDISSTKKFLKNFVTSFDLENPENVRWELFISLQLIYA